MAATLSFAGAQFLQTSYLKHSVETLLLTISLVYSTQETFQSFTFIIGRQSKSEECTPQQIGTTWYIPPAVQRSR